MRTSPSPIRPQRFATAALFLTIFGALLLETACPQERNAYGAPVSSLSSAESIAPVPGSPSVAPGPSAPLGVGSPDAGLLDNRLDLPNGADANGNLDPVFAPQSGNVESARSFDEVRNAPDSGSGSGAEPDSGTDSEPGKGGGLFSGLDSPQGAVRSVQLLLALGVLTLAPALLIMTTSFVRIVVVLSLLRQALGVQNLPPQQVITGLALFMSLFIMYPTCQEIYNGSLVPYQDNQISLEDAWGLGVAPVRRFMSEQIQKSGNDADVWLFWRYLPDHPTGAAADNLTYDDVPTQVLIPAFMVSELKIAFLMGVKFFLPFLIIDFLVASVSVSMGIMMLPPTMISLPLKLLLFVMLDGWSLVVESLIQSFLG